MNILHRRLTKSILQLSQTNLKRLSQQQAGQFNPKFVVQNHCQQFSILKRTKDEPTKSSEQSKSQSTQSTDQNAAGENANQTNLNENQQQQGQSTPSDPQGNTTNQSRTFSRKEQIEQQQRMEENRDKSRELLGLPILSLTMVAASLFIYKCWLEWNTLRCNRAFVFSETNFIKNKNYHSMFLQPISFEDGFHMLMNLPAMLYAGRLIEKLAGPGYFIGLFTINAIISAVTIYSFQRHIGYGEYRRRGRQANHNGNISLFFISFLTTFVPNYMIYQGQRMATTIPVWYLLIMYGMVYFSQFYHYRRGITHARNDNETHYSAVVSGLLLGMIIRKRFVI